jgi:hypothetical protein
LHEGFRLKRPATESSSNRTGGEQGLNLHPFRACFAPWPPVGAWNAATNALVSITTEATVTAETMFHSWPREV